MKIILLLVFVLTPAVFAKTWDCSNTTTGDDSFSFKEFCKLDTSAKQEIRDAFGLARTFYVQGKYDLCLEQIAVMKKKIGSFENSDELKTFCEQGKELDRRMADIERREREASESTIRRHPSSLDKIKMSN